MASGGSKKVIYAALIGNGLIAISKFTAASITGSSAMLSEAIHSVVDTSNQGLLLYGIKRSTRRPDERHPYGYGAELYFWAFVVAIILFAGGAVLSIYEGVEKIRNPHPVSSPIVNFVVLGMALVFEMGAWWIAYKEFSRLKGKRSLIEEVRRSKDPTVFTVLFEDSAAVLGLLVAAGALAINEIWTAPLADGIGSVIIGVILACTAMLLAYETKGLLIGESAHPRVRRGVHSLVTAHKGVKAMNEMLTLHLGPQEVLLNLSVDFLPELSSDEVEEAVSEIEAGIKAKHPEITRIFIEAQSIGGHRVAKQTAAKAT